MKLNEFKQHKQLDELQLSNLIGDYGAAAAQQVGNRLFKKGGAGNLSVQDKMTKNIFINDFIGRATESLRSAIDSGLVDPKATGAVTHNANSQQPASTPTTNTTPAATAAGSGAGASAQAAGPSQAPSTVSKPVVAKTPAEIRAEKLKTNAAAAQSQMAPFSKLPQKAAPATAPTSTIHKATANNPNVTAQTPYVQGRAGAGPNATKFAKYDPATSAMAHADQGINNMVRGGKAPVRKSIQREGTFNKLNYIFESIMNIDEAEPVSHKRSISQHLLNWFTKYMKMDQLSGDAQSQLQNLANEVQSTWGKDKGKGALSKLANLGYTLAQSAENNEVTTGKPVTTPLDTLRKPQAASASAASATSPSSSTTPSSVAQPAASVVPSKTPSDAADMTPSTTTTSANQLSFAQIKQAIDKLPNKSKQELLTYLQSSMKSTAVQTKAGPKTAKPTGAGANAFSQMATQLKKPKAAPEPAYTPPAKLQKIKASKVGGPTPDEEAVLQRKIQQQLARQQ